jgi:hypothetical protein
MTEYNTLSPPSTPLHPAPDWKERASLSLEQHWALAQDLLRSTLFPALNLSPSHER